VEIEMLPLGLKTVLLFVIGLVWLVYWFFCGSLYPFNVIIGLASLFIVFVAWVQEMNRRGRVKPFWLSNPWENTLEEYEAALKELAKSKRLP
jgi:hypothetical protein